MTWYVTLGPDLLKLPSGTEAKGGECDKHGLQSICICYSLGMMSSGDVLGSIPTGDCIGGSWWIALPPPFFPLSKINKDGFFKKSIKEKIIKFALLSIYINFRTNVSHLIIIIANQHSLMSVYHNQDFLYMITFTAQLY